MTIKHDLYITSILSVKIANNGEACETTQIKKTIKFDDTSTII